MNIRKEDNKKTPMYKLNRVISERKILLEERAENTKKIEKKNVALRKAFEDLILPVAKVKKINLHLDVCGDTHVIDFYIPINRPKTTQFNKILIHTDRQLLERELTQDTQMKLKLDVLKSINYYKSFTGLIDTTEEPRVTVLIISKTKYFK